MSRNELTGKFGRFIKKLRVEKRIGLLQFATMIEKETGFDVKEWSKVECGLKYPPDLSHTLLGLIIKTLGTDQNIEKDLINLHRIDILSVPPNIDQEDFTILRLPALLKPELVEGVVETLKREYKAIMEDLYKTYNDNRAKRSMDIL